MPSDVWSGTLTFGLVTLPVRMLSAVAARPAALTMLHDKDAAPLERRMVCPEHGKVVPPRDQVRGFEVTEGEYVVVTDKELRSLAPERSEAIEIEEFVPLDAIDPIWFDRPYYLTPGKGAARPYRLLVQALAETGRAGIAKVVLAEREHLAAVWALEDALCLTTLRFERQRVSPEGLAPEGTRVSHDALDDLVAHIEQATRRFDPGKYPDENELRLMKLVRKRARDEGVHKGPRAGHRRTLSGKRLTRRIDKAIREVRRSRA
jgi:DNA end-binding protein Ku